MVIANQESSRCQFFSLWLDPTGCSNPRPSTLGANAYPLGHHYQFENQRDSCTQLFVRIVIYTVAGVI